MPIRVKPLVPSSVARSMASMTLGGGGSLPSLNCRISTPVRRSVPSLPSARFRSTTSICRRRSSMRNRSLSPEKRAVSLPDPPSIIRCRCRPAACRCSPGRAACRFPLLQKAYRVRRPVEVVIAIGANDRISTGTAKQAIVVRTAIEHIIAGSAKQLIEACSATQSVIAGPTENGIVLRVADAHEIARAGEDEALDIAGEGEAQQRCANLVEAAIVEVFDDRVLRAIDDVDVVSFGADHDVVACASIERIVVIAAIELIGEAHRRTVGRCRARRGASHDPIRRPGYRCARRR